MDLSAIQSHAASADVPLRELAHDHALTKAQKIAEVSQKFEAVLLEQILQETQKPVFISEFTDTSAAASIYRGLITQQLAEAISKSGGFGLATVLDHQLGVTSQHLTIVSPRDDYASAQRQMLRCDPTHFNALAHERPFAKSR